MNQQVYLDNNSTTSVDRRVLEEMLPYFTAKFGNPSNTTHELGAQAAEAVEAARADVASTIGASPREIVFTSGATESNNLAILGAARFAKSRRNHVITSATEHKSVLEPCRQLEQEGFRVTYLPVDRHGLVSVEQLQEAIMPSTVLVSVMAANNEIGTLAPMKEIGALCRIRGVLFHSDAVQAVGRIPVDVDAWSVDLLSMSAHKGYGPKGIGALYISKSGKVGLFPLAFGGGQERGLRSGTLPVPQIVGFGAACRIGEACRAEESKRIAQLRAMLAQLLLDAFANAVIHGHPERNLPGLLNIGFPEIDGDVLIHCLSGVAASQGSSCSAGSFESSHVLRAIGVSDDLARASLRLGIGRFNSEGDIEAAAAAIAFAVQRAHDVSQSIA